MVAQPADNRQTEVQLFPGGPKYALVAQLVERGPEKSCVGGSIPPRCTNFKIVCGSSVGRALAVSRESLVRAQLAMRGKEKEMAVLNTCREPPYRSALPGCVFRGNLL